MPLVYLLIFTFVEVMITSAFVDAFGGFALFIEIVASSMVGVALIASIRGHILEQARGLMNGETDESELVRSSTARLIGGILLIIPGVFTDILALVIQLPFVGRKVLRGVVRTKSKGERDVIDVEVIDSSSSR